MLDPRRSFLILLFATALFATAFNHSPVHAAGMYQLTDLGVPAAGYTVPVFSSSGQVIEDPTDGVIRNSDGSYSFKIAQSQTIPGNPFRTTVYQDGSVLATLNTLVGPGNFDEVFGSAINRSGMVVGTEEATSTIGAGFYFTPIGGMHAVPMLYPGLSAVNAAYSVNDAGLIVGTASGPSGYSYDQPTRAFLSNGQTSWDLNTLIAPGSGLLMTDAFDINDLGQITGLAIDSNSKDHLVLLTPTATPEPSVLMILGAGIVAMGVRKAGGFVRRGGETS